MVEKFKTIIFFLIALLLSYITNYYYSINGQSGNYTHIILTGLYTFIPFIPFVYKRIRYCFFRFFVISLMVFSPLFLSKINQIQETSILIYCLFLSIIFCRNKKRFKGAI